MGVNGGCTCLPPHVGCRTGEKLSPAPAKASSESQRCLLCLCALDIAGGEWGGVIGDWGGAQPCTPLVIPLPSGSCRGGVGPGAHADHGGAGVERVLPGHGGSRVSIWAGGGCRAGTGANRAVTAEGPCPHRAESRAAFIPLLCYSCRLTFKELVRLLGDGGAAVLGNWGSPCPRPLSCRVPLPRCHPTCVLRPSAGSAGRGVGVWGGVPSPPAQPPAATFIHPHRVRPLQSRDGAAEPGGPAGG